MLFRAMQYSVTVQHESRRSVSKYLDYIGSGRSEH
jgi:hypothetical protein